MSYTYLNNPVFFILSAEIPIEIYTKHNGDAFISESFALNLYISTSLASI